MYIHELKSITTICIKNTESSHIYFLTPEGAIYNNSDTDDLTNLAICCGVMLESTWIIINPDDYKEELSRRNNGTKILEVRWAQPPLEKENKSKQPKLTLVD